MGATNNIAMERESFSKIPAFVDVPDLLSIQTKAYQKFLQEWTPIEARKPIGLEGVFDSVFPIEEISDKATLEYLSFRLEKPKFDVDECRQRDLTYSSSLKPTPAILDRTGASFTAFTVTVKVSES